MNLPTRSPPRAPQQEEREVPPDLRRLLQILAMRLATAWKQQAAATDSPQTR